MNLSLLLGSALLVLGTVAIVAAIARAMTRTWTYGTYELWVLPVAGAVLILLGQAILP